MNLALREEVKFANGIKHFDHTSVKQCGMGNYFFCTENIYCIIILFNLTYRRIGEWNQIMQWNKEDC